MEALQNPLAVLKRESDSIRGVIKEIELNIADMQEKATQLSVQKAAFILVVQAIDNEMDRIRIASPTVEQLEFALDPE